MNSISRCDLDDLYTVYNQRDRVHPDPLVFLYAYPDIRDREIAGLLASCLAYGRVSQIYKSLSRVLEKMGPSPVRFLDRSTPESLTAVYGEFSHRFATAGNLVNLMLAIKDVRDRYGSIHACFLSGMKIDADTLLPALTRFVAALTAGNPQEGGLGHLIPLPERGSACKRLNLFLRWMVRKDDVDPGGWVQIPASKLIIPLDVHMHRVGIRLGFTRRKHADMRTALEITRAFSQMIPEDPLRYDFTLCRMGMDGISIP